MNDSILEKMRKLNWLLSEEPGDGVSLPQLSKVFCEMMESNVYIIKEDGLVLGVCYHNSLDTSTYFDPNTGIERISDDYNKNILALKESAFNAFGKEVSRLFGPSYMMPDKFHCFIPAVASGKRYGTLIFTRYSPKFTEEDLALCEYGATVVALELRRIVLQEEAEQERLKQGVDAAISKLSYSEMEAVVRVLDEFEGESALLITSKIADKYEMTRSVVVNALRKLESAGTIESRSLGMKGTRIRIINSYLRRGVKENQLK